MSTHKIVAMKEFLPRGSCSAGVRYWGWCAECNRMTTKSYPTEEQAIAEFRRVHLVSPTESGVRG